MRHFAPVFAYGGAAFANSVAYDKGRVGLARRTFAAYAAYFASIRVAFANAAFGFGKAGVFTDGGPDEAASWNGFSNGVAQTSNTFGYGGATVGFGLRPLGAGLGQTRRRYTARTFGATNATFTKSTFGDLSALFWRNEPIAPKTKHRRLSVGLCAISRCQRGYECPKRF